MPVKFQTNGLNADSNNQVGAGSRGVNSFQKIWTHIKEPGPKKLQSGPQR